MYYCQLISVRSLISLPGLNLAFRLVEDLTFTSQTSHPASFKVSLSDRTTDELCLVSDPVQRCVTYILFPKIIYHYLNDRQGCH